MSYYESGVIYSNQSDNYVKILSIDERINYNQMCIIKLTQYGTENKSIVSENINIYTLWILYLANTVVSYLFYAYKFI